jgi:hypothetical protein
MLVDKLKILSTKSTPEINFNPDGMLIIRGRSMVGDMDIFFKQIDEWIDKYICDPAEITCVDFHLEYLPSSMIKLYITLLRKITSVQLLDKKFIINWYYDAGDEDILEKGENISAIMNITFNFIAIHEPGSIDVQTSSITNFDRC